MKTEDYTTNILVNKDPLNAFNDIANLRAWWSEQIAGNTNKLDETFFYHYKDVHICKIKLVEATPGRKLVYHIIENHFNFTKDSREWTDTRLVFELQEEGSSTRITFTHQGLNASHECYPICHEAWDNYINGSLYSLMTTGKGSPNPKEGEGFNAAIVEKWQLSGK